MFVFWLICFIGLLAVEFMTQALTTIWFCAGAIVAMIVSFIGAPFWLQLILFVAVSLVVLLFYRPLAIKYVNSKRIRTNVDELVGKDARVCERIDNNAGKGRVILNGVDWAARSLDGYVIEEQEMVTVREIQGVKAIVEKKKEA